MIARPLYVLTEEFGNFWEALLVAIEDGDGAIPPEMQTVLDGIEGDWKQKIENCCKVIKDLEYRSESCKAEEKRLEIQRKAADKKIEWLESYVKQAMVAIGREKVETDLFNVKIQKNPAALQVTTEGDIPMRYWATEVVRKLDKDGIKTDLKEGVVVPGVELAAGTRLVIR